MLSCKDENRGFGHTTVRNVMKTIIFLLDVIAGYALVVERDMQTIGRSLW